MTVIESGLPQYKHYYWGIPDSPIDWCENNYEVSPFICEFYNTLSSLIISFFALYGIYILVNGHQASITKHIGIRNKVGLAFSALSTVGVGSAFYHATLLYKNQLFDEFPMIISISLMTYCLLTINKVNKCDATWYRFFRFLLPYALTLYFLGVACTIFIIRNVPTILQVSFGFLVVSLMLQSSNICLRIPEPIRQSNPKKLLVMGATSMATAYIGWLIERKLCRDGYVVPGVQLHAIWHVLSGLGAYYWLQFYICLSLEMNSYKTSIQFNWMGIGSVVGMNKL
eukprot:gene6599-7663_t